MKATHWILIGATLLLVIVIASVALKQKPSAPFLTPQSGETSSPYSPADLQSLIKKLSSPDASERRGAEHDLAQAGVFADSALKAAETPANPPAKEAIQRLRNRSRFLALKNFDYSTALPAETVLYLHLSNIQETLDKSKSTALGKLLLRPAFDKFRQETWEKMKTGYSSNAIMPPIDYLKGQAAFGFFQKTPGQFEKNARAGVLFELSGADPQGSYLEWTDTLQKAGGKISEYNDIECFDSPADKGSHARTGNHIFYGSDAVALHTLIDTVLAGNGIGAQSDVKRLNEIEGKSPDASALLNIPAIIELILLAQTDGPKKTEEEALLSVLEKLGVAGLSSKCVKEGFEDRLTCLLPEGPGEVASALTAPAGARPPVEIFQTVPSGAVFAAAVYFDGAKLEKAAINLANSIRKPDPAKPQPPGDNELLTPLRILEQILGLQKGELLAQFKGEIAFWLELKPGVEIEKPDAGVMLTCADERSAQRVMNILEKINGAPNAFVKSVYNKHTIRTSADKPGSTSISWVAEHQRIYVATSPQLLKGQLDQLDHQSPGLYKRDPLQKVLADFSPEERMGNVVYIDTQAVLTQAFEKYLPTKLADPATPKEEKEIYANLPPPIDLFRDFPSLLAFTAVRKDRAEFIVHSPLPVIPITAAVIALQKQAK